MRTWPRKASSFMLSYTETSNSFWSPTTSNCAACFQEGFVVCSGLLPESLATLVELVWRLGMPGIGRGVPDPLPILRMATPFALLSSSDPSTAVSISSSLEAPLETSSLCWKTQTTYGWTLGLSPRPSSTTMSRCPFCSATTTSCEEFEADRDSLAPFWPLLLSCEPERGVKGGVF